MRTPILLTVCASMLANTPAHAQRDDVGKAAIMLASDRTSLTDGEVRYDLVGLVDPTLEKPSSLFLRVARRTDEGWGVQVYTAVEGILVMSGQFADEQLSIAEGLFNFYYPSGRLESSGMFHDGVKTGIWKRYDRRGRALAERIYVPVLVENEPLVECRSTLSCRP